MSNTTTMPLLVIEAEGKIITSNFAEFAEQVRSRLAEFNTNLRTDEDFDQAAADAKVIAGAEAELKEAKAKALASAEDLQILFSQLDDLTGELAKARLTLTKQVEDQKKKLKERIIEGALELLECDKSMRLSFRDSIEAATKGKKNLTTMQEAVRIALAVANDGILRNRRLLDEFAAEHDAALLPDRRNLETSNPVALVGELRRRVESAAAATLAKRLQAEANQARREAEAARQEAAQARQVQPEKVAPADPSPEPEETPPSDTVLETGIDIMIEWNEFATAVKSAFMALKPARALLTDSSNIDRAAAFAAAVNVAWKGAQP